MPSKKTNSKPEGNVSSGLPLLYNRPVPLDAVRHLQSTITPKQDYSFAKVANCMPLNAIEFIEAMRTYPIVFTPGENVMPVAVVGMEQDNYFVHKDGSWEENTYVPAYVRQYPFIFFENAADEKFYLCVDETSKNFNPGVVETGQRLYDDKGEITDFTKHAMSFCTAFYQQHQITRNFCNDLKEHKLLHPYNAEVVLKDGRKTKLSGFQMIDEAALNKLTHKSLIALRDKGWLPFIYLALASATNWKLLSVFEGKNK